MYTFKLLTLEDKEIFDSFFKCRYENSEASFANLFLWKGYYSTKYTIIDGFLIIMNKSPYGGYRFYYPYGSGDVKKCLLEMYEIAKYHGGYLKITNASKEQAQIVSELFPTVEITENRDFFDYVYLTESLATLSGKKLHSKKNHLNRFKKLYENYRYRQMTKNDFDECLNLAKRLMLKDRTEDDYRYVFELQSITNAFENFETFGFTGGVIEIDGKIVAFTVGEPLTENCALIHIEKADVAYDGIYAAINNEFVLNEWMDYEFINREEDMGIEGIRKAKQSYRPHHMVEKYKCYVK